MIEQLKKDIEWMISMNAAAYANQIMSLSQSIRNLQEAAKFEAEAVLALARAKRIMDT